MIRSLRAVGGSLVALALALSPAQANFTFLNSTSGPITEFTFDSASTPIPGSGNCLSYECTADVPIDKTGTPLFSSTNPGLVGGLGTAGSPSGGVMSIQGVSSGQAVPVSGTFWQTTQPVSGTFWQTTQPVSGTFWQTTQPVSLSTLPALVAGSAIAGKFGIDQTTPGTTNGVSLADIGANAVSTGAGATGTGSQRVGVAQDTTTIAGSAPGAAGTASAQVVTVQGIASMTALLANPATAANWGVGPTGSSVPANGVLGMMSNAGSSVALQGDGTNGLWVNIKAGAGSGGTAAADNAAWTAGTTQQTPIGCEFTSGGASALTTGHVGTPGCTIARALFTDKTSVGATALASATESYGTAFASQSATVERVDAFITNTNSNVEWNADGVAATTNGAPTSSLLMAFNGTTADRLEDDANKNLKVNVEASLGIAATGAAVPSSAVYHAGDAQSSEPAAATTGYLTGAFFDLAGKQVVSPYANRENFVHGTASSNSNTAVTLLASAGSGLKNYAWVTCGRNDAGTSAIYVTFNDTEGTGSGHILVLPNNGGGGGNAWTDPIPLATAAATALTFTPSAATTTVYCNADGYKGY